MQVALDPILRSQMNRCEITLYYLLADMISRMARKSPRGAMYAFPSQKWLAVTLGYSREWICKSMKRLDALGVFLKTYRRKIKGRWRSCLYRFGWLFWKLAGKTREAVRALLNRVKCAAHIFKPTDIKEKQNPISNPDPNPKNLKIEENLTHLRELLKTLA